MSPLRNVALAAAAISLFAPLALAPPDPLASALVTHEWGTFTSVADQDGTPVEWASFLGTPDLPCFVEHLGPSNLKSFTPGLVRMETPVLYFYSPRAISLSVRVQFPHGLITEWYPQASQEESKISPTPPRGFGQIQWDSVRVSPQQSSAFPSSQGYSPYFAARNTDSTPLEIDGQQEKFIFYRGVGNFSIPLRPRLVSDSKIEIRNASAGTLPLAIVFENREGKIGYRIAKGIGDSVELDTPELTGNLADLRQRIADSLVEFGLYKKEASAMLDTWQDSWFEEGMRIFYIVPRERVDSALALEIDPAPGAIARVFVGRVEMLSPWVKEKILTALSAGDTKTVAKFGRFLDPFMTQLEHNRTPAESPVASQYLQRARQRIADESTASCVR